MKLPSDSCEKANIFNRHIQSVFTTDDDSPIPDLVLILHPTMNNIHITQADTNKHLGKLNPIKHLAPTIYQQWSSVK